MLSRLLADRLPRSSPPRRLVVLTGARQVGKTTLARKLYGELLYLNLDSPGERSRLAGVPAEGWAKTVGPAILDEVQKTPAAPSVDATRGRSSGRARSSASATAPGW